MIYGTKIKPKMRLGLGFQDSWHSFWSTASRYLLSSPSRALLGPRWRDAGRDHPSQGHGSSPAALNQIPRCMSDSRDSTVPGQFSISPDFDAELPAVAAPQRVTLHPQQLHISTSRELLAYPWWPFASAKTGYPQESNQNPHDRADSSHCVCRHGATVCMHLWAGIASMSASVAASQAPGLYAQFI